MFLFSTDLFGFCLEWIEFFVIDTDIFFMGANYAIYCILCGIEIACLSVTIVDTIFWIFHNILDNLPHLVNLFIRIQIVCFGDLPFVLNWRQWSLLRIAWFIRFNKDTFLIKYTFLINTRQYIILQLLDSHLFILECDRVWFHRDSLIITVNNNSSSLVLKINGRFIGSRSLIYEPHELYLGLSFTFVR